MTTLKISGMTCQNCVKHVTEALSAVPGVKTVQVDLATETARIEGDAPPEALIQAVEEEDYEATQVA